MKVCHHLSFIKEFYNQNSLLHSRNMARSSFRSVSKIPHCCLSKKSRPCLSPSVADHPFRSAKDQRLGRPLPYQLPNPTRAHFITTYKLCLSKYNGFNNKLLYSFPNYYKVDSHALLTRSLLEKNIPKEYIIHVQLACIKHMISVHSEPGSNSAHFKKISLC